MVHLSQSKQKKDANCLIQDAIGGSVALLRLCNRSIDHCGLQPSACGRFRFLPLLVAMMRHQESKYGRGPRNLEPDINAK